MATIKKKAGLGSTIGGILGGPLGFLGGRSMDRKNQAIKDETIQPAKTGKKVMKKAKNGSFPDLNKDGKITKADILKGRGVIAKSGTKMKTKANYGKSMMSKGGKMKMGGKC